MFCGQSFHEHITTYSCSLLMQIHSSQWELQIFDWHLSLSASNSQCFYLWVAICNSNANALLNVASQFFFDFIITADELNYVFSLIWIYHSFRLSFEAWRHAPRDIRSLSSRLVFNQRFSAWLVSQSTEARSSVKTSRDVTHVTTSST